MMVKEQNDPNPLYLYPMYLSNKEVKGELKLVMYLPDFDLKVLGKELGALGNSMSEKACQQAILLEDRGVAVPLPGSRSKRREPPNGLILVDYHEYRKKLKKRGKGN